MKSKKTTEDVQNFGDMLSRAFFPIPMAMLERCSIALRRSALSPKVFIGWVYTNLIENMDPPMPMAAFRDFDWFNSVIAFIALNANVQEILEVMDTATSMNQDPFGSDYRNKINEILAQKPQPENKAWTYLRDLFSTEKGQVVEFGRK